MVAELHGPTLGLAGQGVWCASAAMPGLLPPKPVEVVPSLVAAVLPVLVYGCLVWDPAGLASLAVVRRRRCPRDCWRMLVGGGCRGAEGWSWVVGARGRKKSMSGLAGTNAVTPAGAAILLEGRRVTLSPLYPPCTGRNPRTRPGSSVVGVAFLLGGAAWYAAGRCHGVWWDEDGGRCGGGSYVLAELPLLAFISSSFSLLGLLCRSPRQLPCDRVPGAL